MISRYIFQVVENPGISRYIFQVVENPVISMGIFQVVENPVISMGIFIIREGERIPLHDHPNMHGVIKCLEGRLRILSFSRRVSCFLLFLLFR